MIPASTPEPEKEKATPKLKRKAEKPQPQVVFKLYLLLHSDFSLLTCGADFKGFFVYFIFIFSYHSFLFLHFVNFRFNALCPLKTESELDPERVSRSGRRIKPKRFADEENLETTSPDSMIESSVHARGQVGLSATKFPARNGGSSLLRILTLYL